MLAVGIIVFLVRGGEREGEAVPEGGGRGLLAYSWEMRMCHKNSCQRHICRVLSFWEVRMIHFSCPALIDSFSSSMVRVFLIPSRCSMAWQLGQTGTKSLTGSSLYSAPIVEIGTI